MPEEPQSIPTIDHALDHFIKHASADGITLNDALTHLGSEGFCFVAFLLAVPFIQPIPLGPLTMICGVSFMVMGWQMARGKTNAALPKKAGSLLIHGHLWLKVLAFCRSILKFTRRFTKERYTILVTGDRAERFVGWLILIGGFLLAIPGAYLPLNNFFPALMIIFACIGWLERDGLMIIISLFWGAVTLLYFAAVTIALVFFGNQLATWIGLTGNFTSNTIAP
ncbi:exopolysaccharide biosynthesis protein [bacterium]|jgi:hypothetical protein|nr:exopolysaccharide biosynthesis protein [bacterium]NBS53698.1 exopolysaccharide biosynthesis protein [Spartobacteria bacterium]